MNPHLPPRHRQQPPSHNHPRYDQVNRIVTGYSSATYSTGPSVCWGEAYSYDQWTNLYANAVLSSSYNGCVQDSSFTVSPTTKNQFAGYSYDLSGNILSDGNTYAWNAESEIKSAAGVNYTYDGDGNRLEKSNGKIYWYGSGTEILDESDLSGNITAEYVFFAGKRIAMRNVSSGNIYYYEEDMLGSSRTMVQAGQTSPCYDADFLLFGYEKDVTSTCTTAYKFEGKERDTETNNDYFGARYYSNHFGRWLSPDWAAAPTPIPYANMTNPQTLNLYAMVSDNPESFADLDGHSGCGLQANANWSDTSGSGDICPAIDAQLSATAYMHPYNGGEMESLAMSVYVASISAQPQQAKPEKPAQQQSTTVVSPSKEKEIVYDHEARSQDVDYKLYSMDPKGQVTPVQDPGAHRVELKEKLLKGKAKICDSGNCVMYGTLVDSMVVTSSGGGHAVLKSFQVDNRAARIYDPATKKAYKFLRVDASMKRGFVFTYENSPQ